MLSVIIITYNSIKSIAACLDSVFSQGYNDLEVILVDNASGDGTLGLIRKDYPEIKIIENKENTGAAKARNQGIDDAKGEWIMTLDCDVVLEKGFLDKIMDIAGGSDKSVGVFQPKIINADKKTIYSCGIYLSRLKRFYDIGKGRLDNRHFDDPKYVFGACSAAALYKRRMLEDVKEETGYFDERFFFLLEDADISFRAQQKNWKALYAPQALCYHFGNSSQTPPKERQYLCWRNRRLFLKKHRFHKGGLFLSLLLYDFPRLFFLLLSNPWVRNEILK